MRQLWRPVVERISLRGEKSRGAPRVPQLPSCSIEITACGHVAQPRDIARIGFEKKRLDVRHSTSLQAPLFSPRRKKRRGHGARTATSDGQDRKSNSLTHRALIDEQVAEVHAIEHVIDLSLEQHPHGPDAAALRLGAALFAYRVCDAMQVERAELRRRNHFAHGDLVRRLREHVAAARTTRAVHETSAPEAKENLLDVVRRQPLTRRDLAPRDWPFAGSLCQVEGADESILGPRRDAHALKLQPTLGECEGDWTDPSPSRRSSHCVRHPELLSPSSFSDPGHRRSDPRAASCLA